MSENSLPKFGKETFVGPMKGKFLDYYDVVKQLGKGGYGKVYEVKNKTTGETISRINDLFYIKNVISKTITTIFLDIILSLVVLIVLFQILV